MAAASEDRRGIVGTGAERLKWWKFNMIHAAIPALVLWLAADLGAPPAGIDLGYLQMYDLQFNEAHKTFAEYAKTFPGDPVGPASNAAA